MFCIIAGTLISTYCSTFLIVTVGVVDVDKEAYVLSCTRRLGFDSRRVGFFSALYLGILGRPISCDARMSSYLNGQLLEWVATITNKHKKAIRAWNDDRKRSLVMSCYATYKICDVIITQTNTQLPILFSVYNFPRPRSCRYNFSFDSWS